MSESTGTKRDVRRWLVPGLICALLVGGIVWAVLSAQSSPSEPGGAPSAPTSTLPPQPTEFETPEPGSTDPVEKPDADPSAETPIDDAATIDDTAEIAVINVESATVGNDSPGEVKGPGVIVTVEVTNIGDKPLDLTGATVNLTYGGDDLQPGVMVTDAATKLLPESLAPGASADGVFVFGTATSKRGEIRVTVDLLATVPDIVFVG